jgi:6-pyruvoyltetrahydropterin/6-carboxytetrahydropterin synthase
MTCTIMKSIEIDAGHRVTNHDSKCQSVHGHRYKIEAHLVGLRETQGAQEGMVLDFGFVKDEMLSVIDARCDHAMLLWDRDPLVKIFVPDEAIRSHLVSDAHRLGRGTAALGETVIGKLYLVPFVPTAENLAEHWFHLLEPRIEARSNKRVILNRVVVWETPSCYAEYRRS